MRRPLFNLAHHRSRRSRVDPRRVCYVIDGLCLLNDDPSPEEAQTLAATVYRLAHVGGGGCSNPHEDWAEEVLTVERALVKARILSPYGEWERKSGI